jgi:hypothetical protein
MHASIRTCLCVVLAIGAGCASTPAPAPPPPEPSLPNGTVFAESVNAGKIDLETYDFAAAGYWRLEPGVRALFQQSFYQSLSTNMNACSTESQRQYAAMMWLVLLNQAADEADWSANARALRDRLKQLDAELASVAPMGQSSDPRVAELFARFARDQAIRGVLTDPKWTQGLPPLAAKNWFGAIMPRWTAIDCENTAWLKAQLKDIQWFDIPTYGTQAETAAWHLVQHADREPAFQRHMLDVLQALPKGHADAKRIAYLWDRVALADKRQQRYGTQGQCLEGGIWKPFDVEDPEHLDQRRAAVGMEPIAEHAKTVWREACPK